MKKLLLSLVLSASPFSVQAAETLHTQIHCIVDQENGISEFKEGTNVTGFLKIGEFTFWPQKLGSETTMLITRSGSSEILHQIEFGDSKSTSLDIALEKLDGASQQCKIKFAVVKSKVPVSYLIF